MITLDDLAAAVVARCAASAAFTAALPGGAWLDRGEDEPTGAYAVFTLALEGEPEWFSDGSYLRSYTLRMAAYTAQGVAPTADPAQSQPSSPQAVQLAMADALNPGPTSWPALRAGSVNICLPRGYDGRHSEKLRGGKDVFVAAGQWMITVEGTR